MTPAPPPKSQAVGPVGLAFSVSFGLVSVAVGAWIAGLDGAVSNIIQPAPLVLPLLGAGAVIATLCWRSGQPAWRNLRSSAGVGLLAVALALWLGTGRPEG